MKRKTFRVGWVVAVLMLITLACTCGPLSQVTQGVSTAQAVASQAQGLATQASDLQTSVATQGIIETLQAVSSEVATSGAVETALAIATGGPDSVRPDLPIMADAKDILNLNGELITYTSSAAFADVVTFYKQEMLNNGWSEDASLNIETQGTAILNFQKAGETANVTITDSGGPVAVVIALTK